MRKQLTTILKRIAKLREEHTQLFKADKWQPMQSINQKIKQGWHEYTLTADGFRAGHKCFNCGKQSDGLAYMVAQPANPEPEEYFCSQECSEQFHALQHEV